MSDGLTIKGGAELAAFLTSLPAKLERNIMRSAMRAGAKVIQQDAKTRIHNVSGKLSAGLKIGTSARAGMVQARLMTRGEHAYLARWVEYGTAAHTITAGKGKALAFLSGGHPVASVEHPGARPHPFMRPALDTQAGAALAAVAERIRVRLTKAGIDLPDEGDEQ